MPFSAFASCAEAVDAKAANTIAPTIPINTRFIWSPLRKAALEMLPCRTQGSTLHDAVRGPSHYGRPPETRQLFLLPVRRGRSTRGSAFAFQPSIQGAR